MREIGAHKPIPGYDGVYEIDTFGNVLKTRGNKAGEMTPVLKNGQLVIRLTDSQGKRKEHRVHKLVQITFLGPTPPGKVLYRKNGDILDNCITNLGFIDRSRLGKMTGYKSKAQAVAKIDADGGIMKVYRSAREAGKDNYISYQTINDHCNGKIKTELAPDGYKYIWDEDYKYEMGT